jgi:hypothetical protein
LFRESAGVRPDPYAGRKYIFFVQGAPARKKFLFDFSAIVRCCADYFFMRLARRPRETGLRCAIRAPTVAGLSVN